MQHSPWLMHLLLWCCLLLSRGGNSATVGGAAVGGFSRIRNGQIVPCNLALCPNVSSTVFLSISEKNDGINFLVLCYSVELNK
jgi:hypothetical protein